MQPGVTYSSFEPAKTGRSKRKFIVVVAVFLVLIMTITLLLSTTSNVSKNNDTAKNFVELVQKSDASTTYDNLASQEFKQSTTKLDWTATVVKVSPFIQGELKPSENSGESSDGVTTYKYIVGDTGYEVTVEITNENGTEKVKYFSSEKAS